MTLTIDVRTRVHVHQLQLAGKRPGAVRDEISGIIHQFRVVMKFDPPPPFYKVECECSRVTLIEVEGVRMRGQIP